MHFHRTRKWKVRFINSKDHVIFLFSFFRRSFPALFSTKTLSVCSPPWKVHSYFYELHQMPSKNNFWFEVFWYVTLQNQAQSCVFTEHFVRVWLKFVIWSTTAEHFWTWKQQQSLLFAQIMEKFLSKLWEVFVSTFETYKTLLVSPKRIFFKVTSVFCERKYWNLCFFLFHWSKAVLFAVFFGKADIQEKSAHAPGFLGKYF